MNLKKLLWYLNSSSQTPEQIAEAFENRVLSDNGTFEAQSCLESLVTSLGLSIYNLASHVDVPNGFKVGKIYSSKPTDGSGDSVFTRTTSGYRKNSTNMQEMGVNTPRLDYLGDTCPSYLFEPARTNLALGSEVLASSPWSSTNLVSTQQATTANNPDLRGGNGIWVDGDYTYIVANTSGYLNIFYSGDKYNPSFISKTLVGGGPIGVIVIGNYALITCNADNCIRIYDITDKINPVLSNTISNNGGSISLSGPWNMFYFSGYLYVGTNNGIQVFSYSAGNLTATDNIAISVVTNIYVVGNYIYYASFAGAAGIVDATDKSNISLSSSISSGTGGTVLTQAHDVVVTADGTKMLVCARSGNTINVLDSSNKSSIGVISVFTDNTNLVGVESIVLDEANNKLYAVNLTGDDFVILSTANYSSLSILGQINSGLDGANKLFLTGNYAEIVCLDGSAYVTIDVSVSATPIQVSRVINNNFRILETVTNSIHIVRQSFTKAASSLSYIAGFVFRGGLGRDYVCFQLDDNTNGAGKFFNLTTGALGNDRTVGSNFTIQESKMIDIGNSEYLCLIRVTSTTSTILQLTILATSDGSTVSYSGDPAKGFYVSKPFLIQSNTPLTDSYILTTSVSVQRTADTTTALTGYNDKIGQTEGTLFFWVKNTWADSVSKAISISDGSLNNRVVIDFTSGNVINALVVSGGITQATISNGSFEAHTEYKVAVTYQNNKASLFVNGSKIGEDLTVTVPACSRLSFDSGAGSNHFYGKYKSRVIIKTALSDADAQILTTI